MCYFAPSPLCTRLGMWLVISFLFFMLSFPLLCVTWSGYRSSMAPISSVSCDAYCRLSSIPFPWDGWEVSCYASAISVTPLRRRVHHSVVPSFWRPLHPADSGRISRSIVDTSPTPSLCTLAWRWWVCDRCVHIGPISWWLFHSPPGLSLSLLGQFYTSRWTSAFTSQSG